MVQFEALCEFGLTIRRLNTEEEMKDIFSEAVEMVLSKTSQIAGIGSGDEGARGRLYEYFRILTQCPRGDGLAFGCCLFELPPELVGTLKAVVPKDLHFEDFGIETCCYDAHKWEEHAEMMERLHVRATDISKRPRVWEVLGDLAFDRKMRSLRGLLVQLAERQREFCKDEEVCTLCSLRHSRLEHITEVHDRLREYGSAA